MLTPDLTHRPSGRMCASCLMVFVQNCSKLPFNTMTPIKRDPDGIIVVRCDNYTKRSLPC
ncbi:hypothetical protein ACUXVY_20580 [Chromobacterium haemolyticum]|uniref:hypothetical protein n=1 Tax=Chromobacterium haemolyticum TaxID=394935 RepID=UPI004056CCF2